MTPLEDQVRDLYRQVTDADQPPVRVSIAEALRRGRLLRRRRRLSAAAAPAVAAAAVAGIALAATLPAHDHRPAPNRPPIAIRPPIPNPAPQPGLLDPLVVNMSFGWLPPGEAALTGGTGDINGSLTVYQERNLNMNWPNRNASTRWRLRDWALGFCTIGSGHHNVHCPGMVGSVAGAAPDINGHHAFWESGYWPHQALVWAYAPGYWAELVSDAGFKQSDQTLLRIARGVAFGGSAAQPVKFAVQLTSVPSGWRIGSTSFMRVSGNWLAQDAIVTIGKRLLWADAVGTYNGLPEVTTFVGGGNCNQLYQFPDQAQWRRINGYKVETYTFTFGNGKLRSRVTNLCAPHANGLLVFEDLQSRPHGPPISLQTLFQHMRVLGSKPSRWTTWPIS